MARTGPPWTFHCSFRDALSFSVLRAAERVSQKSCRSSQLAQYKRVGCSCLPRLLSLRDSTLASLRWSVFREEVTKLEIDLRILNAYIFQMLPFWFCLPRCFCVHWWQIQLYYRSNDCRLHAVLKWLFFLYPVKYMPYQRVFKINVVNLKIRPCFYYY
jgi:hypothetical protein